MQTYTAQRGETCRFLLHSPLDTDLTGYSVTCQMRRHNSTFRKLDLAAEPAAELAVTSFAGDSERGPGWYLTLSDSACEALALGRYALDARIAVPGGDTVITDPWVLEIVNHVTEPPA